MGALDSLSDYLSDYFYVSIKKRKKRKVMQVSNIPKRCRLTLVFLILVNLSFNFIRADGEYKGEDRL